MRLASIAVMSGLLGVGCGCPSTDYQYDRTIRLDPNSADPAVQAALAAPIGADLGASGTCNSLCETSQSGTSNETVLGCERGQLEADPALICHISGHDDCGGVGRMRPGLEAPPARTWHRAPDVRGAYLARAAQLATLVCHYTRTSEWCD